MSERPPSQRDEKSEKDEKGRDEKSEKDRDEKDWNEKWRRDPVGTASTAAVLIWIGLVLLASNIGWLDPVTGGRTFGGLVDAQLGLVNLIIVGIGVIELLEVAYRLINPAYRRPVTGSVVLGVILIAVGLAGFAAWQVLLPVILIAVGIGLLVTRLFQQE